MCTKLSRNLIIPVNLIKAIDEYEMKRRILDYNAKGKDVFASSQSLGTAFQASSYGSVYKSDLTYFLQ